MKRRNRPARCGTEGGYYRHVRGAKTVPKTVPCQACCDAHAVEEVAREQRRRYSLRGSVDVTAVNASAP